MIQPKSKVAYLSRTPSTETTKGEKEAWRALAAIIFILFSTNQKHLQQKKRYKIKHQFSKHGHQIKFHHEAATPHAHQDQQ